MERIPVTPLKAAYRNLSRLPPETIHQIIDDLPIVNVLKILSHNDAYLNDCILSHIGYQKILPSLVEAADMTEYFILHREICQFLNKALAGEQSPCGSSYMYQTYAKASRHSRDNLQENLRNGFKNQINATVGLNDVQKAILAPYGPQQYPIVLGDSYQNLVTLWKWTKSAILNINAVKAQQRNKIADLISKYPGKIMLKKPQDPSQAGPRFNTEHISKWFRDAAKRSLQNRKIPKKGTGRCYHALELIELIPYDRCLWSFLGTLERYPPENPELDFTEEFQKMSLDGKEKLLKTYKYPEEIAAKLKVVMDGLMYVYTRSPLLVIPRIRWPTKEEVGVPLYKKPFFFVDTTPHDRDGSDEAHQCFGRRIRPHDEREYEWLEGFLEVLAWMEENPDLKIKKQGLY
ncbi:hypothetical protein G7Y89_g5478 [Cudoniella acicularis]|uniref:Uncharacterized protein n=1 Tax=Cudoniella acicularis TaxID=354080 RepID=A0A8H4RNT4_9HELO|nr:hypothetical protein G7Y89_g5478 [Cudoniella acicularis]